MIFDSIRYCLNNILSKNNIFQILKILTRIDIESKFEFNLNAICV